MFESDRGKPNESDHKRPQSLWDVRWSWTDKYDLDELTARFSLDFEVTKPKKTRPVFAQSILWEELLVKSDNLSALLSSLRACLFQKQVQALTYRDLKLRQLVYKLYPSTQHPFFSPLEVLFDLAFRATNKYRRIRKESPEERG